MRLQPDGGGCIGAGRDAAWHPARDPRNGNDSGHAADAAFRAGDRSDGLDLTATQPGPAGEYDRAYIVAKYVGSWVNVFGVTWESGRLNVGDKALYSFRTGQGDVIGGSFDRPDGGAMYYLTVTAPDGSDFGEYLTYNGRWGSPQKEYLMDTCWNAEAVLREAAGADEDWELYDSRLIQDDGIPYVCFRLEGETERYALVPPDGSCVYAAELDPDTDRYCITGVF